MNPLMLRDLRKVQKLIERDFDAYLTAEITSEMVEAGLRVYRQFDPGGGEPESLVRDMFSSMWQARFRLNDGSSKDT